MTVLASPYKAARTGPPPLQCDRLRYVDLAPSLTGTYQVQALQGHEGHGRVSIHHHGRLAVRLAYF